MANTCRAKPLFHWTGTWQLEWVQEQAPLVGLALDLRCINFCSNFKNGFSWGCHEYHQASNQWKATVASKQQQSTSIVLGIHYSDCIYHARSYLRCDFSTLQSMKIIRAQERATKVRKKALLSMNISPKR